MKKLTLASVLLFACRLSAQVLPNAVPMPTPEIQYLDSAGMPLAGAKLCTYAAGTSTPLATYTSSTAGTPNTNPIILDSYGRASVWVGPQLYKFVLRQGGNGLCTTGTVLWTQDNVADTTLYFVNYVKSIGTATMITYTNPLTGAIQRTVSDRLSDIPSLKDFGGKCDQATDDSPAMNLMIAAAQGNPHTFMIPYGTCILGADVTVPSNITLLFTGGQLSPASGKTLTVNGPINAAPTTQIFAGIGAILISGTAELHSAWFPGGDCGAQLNKAYSALTGSGAVLVQDVSCTFSTQIYFGSHIGTLLKCPPGGIVNMTYTGTGAAITLDFDQPGRGEHQGRGVYGCGVTGPGNSTSTIGILLGFINSDNHSGGPGDNGGGALYSQINHVLIQGFGVDLQVGPNTWMVHVENSTLRDATNVYLQPDGGGSVSHPIGFNVGAEMVFTHVEFEGPVGRVPADCVRIHGGGTDTIIRDSDLNGCQVHLGSGTGNGSKLVIDGNHWENDNAQVIPGRTTYPYLIVDQHQGNIVSITHNWFFQGVSDTPWVQDQFILANGGQITLDDNITYVSPPSTITNFITANNATNVTIRSHSDLSVGPSGGMMGGNSDGFMVCWPGMNTGQTYTHNFSIGQGVAACQGGALWDVQTTVDRFSSTNVGENIKSSHSLVALGTNSPEPSIVIGATTPITHLYGSPIIYSTSGVQVTDTVHMVVGEAHLSGGTFTVNLLGPSAFLSFYECVASDRTTANAVRVFQVTNSQFTLQGTGADLVSYTCIGY